MFSLEKSDFGSTIAGFFFSAVLMILLGMYMINEQTEWLVQKDVTVVLVILALFCMGAGCVALRKAFLVDGMSYLLAGFASIAVLMNAPVYLLVLIIAAAAICFMAYRFGDYFSLAFVAITALGLLFVMLSSNVDVFTDNPAIAGTVFLIAGLLFGYRFLDDWMLAQDIINEYDDEMFDGCDCGCGDEECGDDCECHCHDKEE